MKINDLFESEVDEGFGSALAAGARGLAKGAGAVAGGIAGMGSAAKQGYQAGKAAVGAQPTPPPGTAPAVAPAGTPAPDANVASAATGATAPSTSGSAPAAAGGSAAPVKGTADFGTIQRSIKTLSPKQKTALSTQLSGGKPAASAPGETPAAPDANAAAPAAPEAPAAPTTPAPDQIVKLSSGESYKWLGQQWAEIDPATGQEKGGQMEPASFQKSLTDIALKQQAAPAAPAAGAPPNLKVVNGGQQATAESRDFKSKFLQILI